MTKREYELMFRWCLGIPILTLRAPLCGLVDLDQWCDHAVTCHKNASRERRRGVEEAMAVILRQHGVACFQEQSFGAETAERPADVCIPPSAKRRQLCVDLSVVSPDAS